MKLDTQRGSRQLGLRSVLVLAVAPLVLGPPIVAAHRRRVAIENIGIVENKAARHQDERDRRGADPGGGAAETTARRPKPHAKPVLSAAHPEEARDDREQQRPTRPI